MLNILIRNLAPAATQMASYKQIDIKLDLCKLFIPVSVHTVKFTGILIFCYLQFEDTTSS